MTNHGYGANKKEYTGAMYIFVLDKNGTYKEKMTVRKAVGKANERFGYDTYGLLLDDTNIYAGTSTTKELYFYPHGIDVHQGNFFHVKINVFVYQIQRESV